MMGKVSIYTKVAVSVFLGCFFVLIVVSAILYLETRSHLKSKQFSHLTTISDIKKAQLQSFIEFNRDQVKLVASRTKLRNLLDGLRDENSSESQSFMSKILQDAIKSVQGMNRALIYDLDQQYVVGTDRQSALEKDHVATHILLDDLDRPIVWEEQSSSFHIQIVEPLFIRKKPIGFLVIEFNPKIFLNALSSVSGMGNTGEIILARKAINSLPKTLHSVRFPDRRNTSHIAEFIEDKNVLDITSSFRQDSVNPVIENVPVLTYDYRGEKVMGVLSFLEDLNWWLVVKVDYQEVFEPVTKRYILITILLLIFLIISVLTAYIFLIRSTRNAKVSIKSANNPA